MTVTTLDSRRLDAVQGEQTPEFPRGFTRRFSQEHAELIVASGALEALGNYLGFVSMVIDESVNVPGALAMRVYGQHDAAGSTAESIMYITATNRFGMTEEQISTLGLPAVCAATRHDSFAEPYAKIETIIENYGYQVARPVSEMTTIAAA